MSQPPWTGWKEAESLIPPHLLKCLIRESWANHRTLAMWKTDRPHWPLVPRDLGYMNGEEAWRSHDLPTLILLFLGASNPLRKSWLWWWGVGDEILCGLANLIGRRRGCIATTRVFPCFLRQYCNAIAFNRWTAYNLDERTTKKKDSWCRNASIAGWMCMMWLPEYQGRRLCCVTRIITCISRLELWLVNSLRSRIPSNNIWYLQYRQRIDQDIATFVAWGIWLDWQLQLMEEPTVASINHLEWILASWSVKLLNPASLHRASVSCSIPFRRDHKIFLPFNAPSGKNVFAKLSLFALLISTWALYHTGIQKFVYHSGDKIDAELISPCKTRFLTPL